jgi:hypothetical protein
MGVAALILAMVPLVLMAAVETAMASPSGQIWIPSTDVQPFKKVALGIDNFFRASRNPAGGRDANTLDIGLTTGVLPFRKLQMEAGFDFLVTASDPNDQHPWSGNVKVATPEDSICKSSPAFAIGLYNARPVKGIDAKDAPGVSSGQNLAYALMAKTVPALGPLPSLGRFSAGYYRGSRRALVNENGQAANDGILLSWDRTMTEVTDRLWFAVDYQGGNNVDGAVNFGFSWSFAKNVSLIFGYDVYTRKSLAGENTLTTQLEINFP